MIAQQAQYPPPTVITTETPFVVVYSREKPESPFINWDLYRGTSLQEKPFLDDFETFVEMFGTDEIMARFESETEKWTGTGEVTKDQMIVNIATDFYSS